MKIHSLDLNFRGAPRVVGTYVIESQDGLLMIDPGPESCLPELKSQLAHIGYSLKDIRHILLTHIHFDHAGVSGYLQQQNGAKVYVHEKGAPHMFSPEKLWASAKQIYQDDMDTLWGGMQPLDPQNTQILQGGEVLDLGEHRIEVIYTPGHAVHHVSFFVAGNVFCGDVAGVRLDTRQEPRAPTPPPDIDIPTWQDSIAKLKALNAHTVYVAHYGAYSNATEHFDQLLHNLQHDAQAALDALKNNPETEAANAAYHAVIQEILLQQGDEHLFQRFGYACPSWMSLQGLRRYWKRAGQLN